MRIGPGQYEFNQRKFGHLFDAFGKLYKWTFYGNGSASFTAKLLKSDFYIESNSTKDIAVAQLFSPTEPPLTFNFSDIPELMTFLSNGTDNPNMNVFNLSGNCVAFGFGFPSNDLSCYSLESVATFSPTIPNAVLKYPFLIKFKSSQMLPEFGTDNHVTMVMKLSVLPLINHEIIIARVLNIVDYEIIGRITGLMDAPFMPTFSVTENYIVVFMPPLYLDVAKFIENPIFRPNLEFRNGALSFIFVIDKRSGKQTLFKTTSAFVMNQVNAYETNKSTIFLDVCMYNDSSVLDNFELRILRNKTLRDRGKWRPRLTRFQLNIDDLSLIKREFTNSQKVEYSAEFEFPTINEKFRSIKYCFVYGIVFSKNNTSFAEWKIVKKNLCNETGDLQFDDQGLYPTEVTFVSDPNGIKEDDGYLLMPAFNSNTNISLLIILDARTMIIINSAPLPTIVPFTFHGRMFQYV